MVSSQDLNGGVRLPKLGRIFGAAAFAFSVMAMPAVAAESEDTAPEQATPEHPLHMLVSINEQRLDVYRGLQLIETTPISSGKRGHSTPTGVFSILEKRRRHFSNLYDNAPMPYMQRLTWSGIALHEGKLPGYPASHGCIRLPRSFAKSIFGETQRGMHVVVTRDLAAPLRINHSVLPQPYVPQTEYASLAGKALAANPGLRGGIQPATLPSELTEEIKPNPHFDQPLRMIITPQAPPSQAKVLQRLLNKLGYEAGPVDGIVGRKTRAAIEVYQEGADLPITGNITDSLVSRIYGEAGYREPKNAMLRVRRKFRDIYSAPVSIAHMEQEIGTHVFTALAFEEGDKRTGWIAVTAEGERGGRSEDVLDRIEIPEEVAGKLARILTPGTSLTVTDRSFKRNTGLGTDFVVITR